MSEIATQRTTYNKKWEEKNKDYANYLKNRASARSFIKNKAQKEDLEEFKGLIQIREEVLNSEETEQEEK